jgi:hypothetical protein
MRSAPDAPLATRVFTERGRTSITVATARQPVPRRDPRVESVSPHHDHVTRVADPFRVVRVGNV